MNPMTMSQSEIFKLMEESNAAHLCMTMNAANGKAIGAIIYILGDSETKEIVAAVEAIADSWHPEGGAMLEVEMEGNGCTG